MVTIYNCHTHIFTNRHVPVKFLPLGLIRCLCKRHVSRKLGRFLHRLNRVSSVDIFDRFAAFMNIGNFSSQLEIFNFLKGFYPEGSKFIVLSMDMEYMAAGMVPEPFESQLDELAGIKLEYPDQIFPFICVDPRRPNITDLVKKYIEEYDFAGIKIYPPLGYYPFDVRLHDIYHYALTHDVPITAHCSMGGVYYRGKITPEMLVHPRTSARLMKKKKKDFTNYFTHPDNFEILLQDFPNLKMNLGHFGGEEEVDQYLATSWDKSQPKSWFSMIINLIKKYPNAYTDISYTMCDVKRIPLLKVLLTDPRLRTKILYGSDFYMVEIDLPERAFSINLRAYLGEDDYRQIAEVNPKRFLLMK